MKQIHPYLIYLVALCFPAIFLTSCGDIQQELYLNADGSGKLEASFGLGEMMSMMKGFDEMSGKEDTVPDAEADEIDTTQADAPAKDPMQKIIDRVTDPAYAVDFDTLINLYDIMPDSIKKKENRPELVKRSALRLQSPAKSSELTIGIVLTFANQNQLKDIINHLDTIDGKELAMGGSTGGFPKESFTPFEADMKAGWIRVDSSDYRGFAGEMSTGMPEDSTSSSEDMGMMQMMFGNSKIKSIIHVPGEVLSCTNKDALITKDNKVIIEHDFMDAFKQGKLPGYTIRFKPKG